MKFAIKSFTDANTVTITTAGLAGLSNFGPMVHALCDGGSVKFQHTMTTQQARDMAAALIACADEEDSIQDAATAILEKAASVVEETA